MARVVVTVFPVGQGAMNLVEVYDNENMLQNLSLIDCGIDRTSPANFQHLDGPVKNSVVYVVEKMRERQQISGSVFLDYVLFTHRDADHWTLFDCLWETLTGVSLVAITTDNWSMRYGQRSIDAWTEDAYFIDTLNDLAECTRTSKHIVKGYYWNHFEGRLSFYEDEVMLKITCQGIDGQYTIKIDSSKACHRFRFYDNYEENLLLNAYLTVRDDKTAVVNGTYEYETETETEWIYTSETVQWESFTPHTIFEEVSLWVGFGKDMASGYGGAAEILGQLDYCLQDSSFFGLTKEYILGILPGEGGVRGAIGQVLVGGSVFADQTKSGRDSGVKKMLKRAEMLSLKGVVELSKGWSFELGGPFVLSILERLDLDTLRKRTITNAKNGGDTAIQKNGTSAVSSLENNEDGNFPKFVFTGDATIHTFYEMYRSQVFEMRQNAVWTAPHHGSYPTIKGDIKTLPLFPFFLYKFDPFAVIVSAGYPNKHGHPNITFIQWLRSHLRKKRNIDPSHSICYNDNDSRTAEWKTGIIDENVFTGRGTCGSLVIAQAYIFSASPGAQEFEFDKRRMDLKETVKTVKSECTVPHADLFFRRH